MTYTQTYPNSCGAVSLMCTAIELGHNTIPINLALHTLWNAVHHIEDLGDRPSETLIYAVTANVPMPNLNSGYSLPSRIGLAARALGIHSIAFVPRTITGSALLSWYGSESADAQANGMLLSREEAPLPIEKQRLLRILRVGSYTSIMPATGLHYVMVRPDLTVMDPAVGRNFVSLSATIAAHRAEGTFYQDTGIAILLT